MFYLECGTCLNFHLSFLDLLKGKQSPVSDSVIICIPQKEVTCCSDFYLLYQDKHCVSCPDDHYIFWINAGPSYHFNLIRFFPLGFWDAPRQAWVLVY